MNVLYSLQHLGYVIPPQADAGWIGEAGPGPSYLDPGSGGPDNDFTNRNTTFMTWNLLHLARMITDAGGIPVHGNQRAALFHRSVQRPYDQELRFVRNRLRGRPLGACPGPEAAGSAITIKGRSSGAAFFALRLADRRKEAASAEEILGLWRMGSMGRISP